MIVVIAFGFALPACDDGDGATDSGPADAEAALVPFFDAQFAVEIDAADAVQRDACGFLEGEVCEAVAPAPSLTGSCTAVPALSFDVGPQGGPWSISVQDANSSACELTYSDESGTFTGRCGTAAPDARQPCRVVETDRFDDMGNPTVTLDVFCLGLPGGASTLNLHGPGAGAMAQMSPAMFRIANCPGL